MGLFEAAPSRPKYGKLRPGERFFRPGGKSQGFIAKAKPEPEISCSMASMAAHAAPGPSRSGAQENPKHRGSAASEYRLELPPRSNTRPHIAEGQRLAGCQS